MIRQATPVEIPLLYDLYQQIGHKQEGYFERCFDEGYDLFIIRSEEDVPAGFCILNFAPLYSLYQKLGYPELQDLNILPMFRRRGYASALVKHCEQVAKQRGAEGVGISVGLTRDYGAAQRLYTKMGYVPDGFGLTYERQPVVPQSLQRIDDNLCLMLMKTLD
ncbi:MAG: GNAT family N-acetyltransferase [Alphaproteobacteria bacterium]|nr:GNAT family N-acetyltransferase [Alphaproteobacteria bacterium]